MADCVLNYGNEKMPDFRIPLKFASSQTGPANQGHNTQKPNVPNFEMEHT